MRDRLSYFCARLDGKYDPPWAKELVGIIDDALSQDAPTPVNMAECRSALKAIADSARTGSVSTLPSAALVLKTCEKALAAPARNCDLYADKVKARTAFLSEKCEDPCGNCTVFSGSDALCHPCGIDWLFAISKKGATDGK